MIWALRYCYKLLLYVMIFWKKRLWQPGIGTPYQGEPFVQDLTKLFLFFGGFDWISLESSDFMKFNSCNSKNQSHDYAKGASRGLDRGAGY